MIELITGTPGAGKTLMTVGRVLCPLVGFSFDVDVDLGLHRFLAAFRSRLRRAFSINARSTLAGWRSMIFESSCAWARER